MLSAGRGRVITISMSEQTMTRRGFIPYGPSGAAVEALARVMAADLADTPVRANILLPGGATATGMLPAEISDELRENLLDRRSWDRRSSGLPLRMPPQSTTSGSSPASSTGGWRHAKARAR
jgi:NAD(P)-dependent dehydrogenase (short-subunit alcohol dehydrogenase family)